MEAPKLQVMTPTAFEHLAMSIQGVVITRSMNPPPNAPNHYKIAVLPADKQVCRDPKTLGYWQPSDQELEMLPGVLAAEGVFGCSRLLALAMCGGLNPSKLTMHLKGVRGEEAYIAKRTCGWGAWMCCPRRWVLQKDGAMVGEVREDFSPYCGKLFECCCQCTHYARVSEQGAMPTYALNHVYTLRVNQCCCGRVDNCCGATCCHPDAVFDILDPQGNVAATIQKTYAPAGDSCCECCSTACYRCTNHFGNYLLEFPKDASAATRALLMSGVLYID